MQRQAFMRVARNQLVASKSAKNTQALEDICKYITVCIVNIIEMCTLVMLFTRVTNIPFETC